MEKSETLTKELGCSIIYNGIKMTHARYVRRVYDFRETPFGLVNFGYVEMGKPFYIVRPHPASRPKRPWWKFWEPKPAVPSSAR